MKIKFRVYLMGFLLFMFLIAFIVDTLLIWILGVIAFIILIILSIMIFMEYPNISLQEFLYKDLE